MFGFLKVSNCDAGELCALPVSASQAYLYGDRLLDERFHARRKNFLKILHRCTERSEVAGRRIQREKKRATERERERDRGKGHGTCFLEIGAEHL
jgi:hypothetical protein